MKIDIKINDVGKFHLHGENALEDMQTLAKELRKKML